jgi:uncharacterized membrane-anchored protein
MSRQMDRILQDAVVEGLLGPAAAPSPADERHWSVIAFTAFAAWLSAVPLVGVILGLFFLSDHLESLCGVLGLPILVASVLVLRARKLSLFVEQLAVPGLLAGAGLLAFQVLVATDSNGATLMALLIVASAVALAVPQAWVRTLMGVAIGVLTVAGLPVLGKALHLPYAPSLPWSLVACEWLALYVVQRAIVLDAARVRRIAGLEAVSAGIAAAALAGIIWSGPTFLVSGISNMLRNWVIDSYDGETMRALSAALALGGGLWLARCWTVLRTAWYAALLGVTLFFAWCLPALGAALLILFVCAESKRYVLASFAGVAVVWLVGGFYYEFGWPLAYKALLLAGTGIVMALAGRYAVAAPAALAEPRAEPQAEPQPGTAPLDRRTRAAFLLCGLLVLGVANAAIWQKEHLIRTGAVVFVELVPADPRSLMQGDYMSLRFALPVDARPDAATRPFIPQVVARVDARGIAQLLRYNGGQALANGERLINLVHKHGDWVVVTDAWYCRDDDGERWSKARYGEFRVDPDGKALLVGLRGPNLEKL